MMKYEDIHDTLFELTGVSIHLEQLPKNCSMISLRDLQQVATLFNMWQYYISQEYRQILLSNLVLDLLKIHCCGICTNPNSPFYIVKMADGCTLKANLQPRYTSYGLGALEIKNFRDAK